MAWQLLDQTSPILGKSTGEKLDFAQPDEVGLIEKILVVVSDSYS